jgi:hypothetical protein
MVEYVRDCDLTISDTFSGNGFLLTILQVGMAFFAMAPVSLAGYALAIVFSIVTFIRNKNTRLPDHYVLSTRPSGWGND